jgi:hypothetical protein
MASLLRRAVHNLLLRTGLDLAAAMLVIKAR